MSKGEAALKGVPGVQEATINLATSTATVTLTGEREAVRRLTASDTSLVRSPKGLV